ncbi:hypothetical protein GCM10027570_50590 [Streptomonospora sediminis]
MRRSGWLLIGAMVALVVLLGGGLTAYGSVELGGSTRSDDFAGADTVKLHHGSGGDVDVHRATGDRVTIERELRSTPLTDPREDLSMDGGTLVAESACGGAWMFGGCEIDYSIGVPEGTEVQIEAASGDVDLNGVAGDIKAETNTGTISGENLTGKIHAGTSTGEIELSGVEGDLDLESNTGSISASGKGGTVKAESNTGELELGGFDADRFELETTTGDIDLEAGFSVAEVEATTGSVDIEALEEFSRIDVETSTGEVDVQVPHGAYQVSGDSTTGERDIDVEMAGNAEGEIEVTTTTGGVNVGTDD